MEGEENTTTKRRKKLNHRRAHSTSSLSKKEENNMKKNKYSLDLPQFNSCTSPKVSSALHFGDPNKMAFIFNKLNEVKGVLEEEEGEKMKKLVDQVQNVIMLLALGNSATSRMRGSNPFSSLGEESLVKSLENHENTYICSEYHGKLLEKNQRDLIKRKESYLLMEPSKTLSPPAPVTTSSVRSISEEKELLVGNHSFGLQEEEILDDDDASNLEDTEDSSVDSLADEKTQPYQDEIHLPFHNKTSIKRMNKESEEEEHFQFLSKLHRDILERQKLSEVEVESCILLVVNKDQPINKKTLEFDNYLKEWKFGPGGIWNRLCEKEYFDGFFSIYPLTVTFLRGLHALKVFEKLPCLDPHMMARATMSIESSYLEVPYHNAYHATDVLQSMIAMLSTLVVEDPIVVLAMLFSAAIHDVGHPGVNNAYLSQTQHELALRYNDISILENFHVSHAFMLISSRKNMDFISVLRAYDFHGASLFRQLVIDMVLSTDLTTHYALNAKVKATADTKFVNGNLLPKDIDATLFCCALLHGADISCVAKQWSVYHIWMKLLFHEFFKQGDEEKSEQLSTQPFMDREVSNPAKTQIGFINGIVLPYFNTISAFIPETCLQAKEQMILNLKELEAIQDDEDNQENI